MLPFGEHGFQGACLCQVGTTGVRSYPADPVSFRAKVSTEIQEEEQRETCSAGGGQRERIEGWPAGRPGDRCAQRCPVEIYEGAKLCALCEVASLLHPPTPVPAKPCLFPVLRDTHSLRG